jgi:hypothetical protein
MRPSTERLLNLCYKHLISVRIWPDDGTISLYVSAGVFEHEQAAIRWILNEFEGYEDDEERDVEIT